MTWLDIVILLAILGFMGLGFAQGLVRRLIDLGSLYMGVVVAALYEPRLSRAMTAHLGPSVSPGREAFIFLILLMAIVVGLNTVGYLGYRNTRLPIHGTIDRLSGLAVGILTGLLWVMVALLLINFITQTPWPSYDHVRRFFADAWRGSLLVPAFVRGTPLIGKAVSPWLPAGLPVIFSIQ